MYANPCSVKTDKAGKASIDWKDAYAVRYVPGLTVVGQLGLTTWWDSLATWCDVFHDVVCSELTKTLLQVDFKLKWDLPIDRLCPTVRCRL